MRVHLLFAALVAGPLALGAPAYAADAAPAQPPTLVLRNSQFEPKELPLPEGIKVKLIVRNMDDAPAEFESYDLSREVVVAAHGEAVVYVGPLQPGTYKFFNDFNRSMQGTILVKPTAIEKK
jgi:Cupredoxin-like domain